MMVFFLVCVYYNIIIVWCLYYFFLSMVKDVFWKFCGNWWNIDKCFVGRILEIICVNSSVVLVNGIVIFVNVIVVMVNVIVINCTLVKDLIFLFLEYWE